MRISGWSSDVCSSDLALSLFSSALSLGEKDPARLSRIAHIQDCVGSLDHLFNELLDLSRLDAGAMQPSLSDFPLDGLFDEISRRSEEHTSELQSLMRISYAVSCLKKKTESLQFLTIFRKQI